MISAQADGQHIYFHARPGDIVRYGVNWGVHTGWAFAGIPLWAWYDEDGTYIDQLSSVDQDISAPFDWKYPGIPEPVLVRATAERLRA